MITKLTLRIDWSEMDLFGHVNNVSFFKYIQASRVHFWENVGISATPGHTGPGCMLASASCTFLKPLHYPGELTIETSLVFVKKSSFGLKHIIKNANGEAAAEGNDVIVLYDFINNSKVEIPAGIRTRMEQT